MTLVSLQALRGLAALGVVMFHLLPFETKHLAGVSIVPAGFAAGRAGVDLFFVLSGFLAVWTTQSARGCSGRGGAAHAAQFLLRRVSRIYPTYWFYCLLLLTVGAAVPGVASEGAKPDVVASLLLVPSEAPPLLLVGWTLMFEIYFYVVFALLMWTGFGPGPRALWLVLWGGVVLAGHCLLRPARSEAVLDALLSPLVFEFLAGCAAAYACRVVQPRTLSAVAGLLGCVLLVASLAWCETLFSLPWLRVAGFGAGGALLMIGCVGAEATLRRLLPRWVVGVGDASYSLYLSHLFTLAVVGRALSLAATHAPVLATWLLATPSGHAAALVVAVLASLLVAEASYRYVERPLLRLTRLLAQQPRLAATAVAPTAAAS